MSTTSLEETAFETICRIACTGVALDQHGPDRLEEGNVIPDAEGLRVRHGQRERPREVPHRSDEAVLPVLLRQHDVVQALPGDQRVGLHLVCNRFSGPE
jgi:hypothetical protein